MVITFCVLVSAVHTLDLSVTGRTDTDSNFHWVRISKFPSTLITIQFSMLCYLRKSSVKMEIWTTDFDGPRNNCTDSELKQFASNHLQIDCQHKDDPHEDYETQCKEISQHPEGWPMLHCTGVLTIQDFKPRIYSAAFLFRCVRLEEHPDLKLFGLEYNFTVLHQSNITECVEIDFSKSLAYLTDKYKYTHTSLPNLVGSMKWDEVQNWLDFIHMADLVGANSRGQITTEMSKCLGYAGELIYRVVVPRCEPQSRAVEHPCREMCHEFLRGCHEHIELAFCNFEQRKKVTQAHINCSHIDKEEVERNVFDCDYLPSTTTDACFYKPILCETPRNVTNAVVVLNSTSQGDYHPNSTVDYACAPGTYWAEGNTTAVCSAQGVWTGFPTCVVIGYSPIAVVAPIFLIALGVFAALVIAIKCSDRRKTHESFKRNRKFDAFVCCHFDSENHYVVTTILPEFEENQDPPFRLCYHERDFTPGHFIEGNIQKAIENSNSAIILISQSFLNSRFCLKEFMDCLHESVKDPAFKLFAIFMEPVKELVMNEHVESFIQRTTYASETDPKFDHIMSYLRLVKDVDSEDNDEQEEGEEGIPLNPINQMV